MKYMMLIYANYSERQQLTPEEFRAENQAWLDFRAEVQAAGVFVANDGLAPASDATTVRVRDGKTLIADGPFAETHEQLGGYFMLDCENLDEALKWAAKIPGAKFGTIEVRPIWQGPK